MSTCPYQCEAKASSQNPKLYNPLYCTSANIKANTNESALRLYTWVIRKAGREATLRPTVMLKFLYLMKPPDDEFIKYY